VVVKQLRTGSDVLNCGSQSKNLRTGQILGNWFPKTAGSFVGHFGKTASSLLVILAKQSVL